MLFLHVVMLPKQLGLCDIWRGTPQRTSNNIIKPPQSGDLCEDITEFVVEEDHLSLQGKGDLLPPQTK